MDEPVYTLLERIAEALESISTSLRSRPDPKAWDHYSDFEWDNKDLSDLYAQLELGGDEENEPDDDEWEDTGGSSYTSSESARDYFNAMTDGMMGDYDDFADRGGNIDWISDWAGR